MKLAAGTMLQDGKYLLNHALGREAFSITYRATQNYLRQVVVIKTLHPSLQVSAGFPQLQQRFIQVARQLARSQHPSLVRVLDFFQEGGLPFVVMEYVPGQTLAELVQTQGILSKPEAIHYARQLGTALSVAHSGGLFHGNLKPHTVIRRQGTNLAVVVGFGIAYELASVNPAGRNPYVAPEQATVPQPTPAIDLYALSAILSYLLTGSPLGAQASSQTSVRQRSLERAIFQGLAQDPQQRPTTIAAWLDCLPEDTLPLATAPNLPARPSSPRPTSAAPRPVTPPPGNGHQPIAPPLLVENRQAASPPLPEAQLAPLTQASSPLPTGAPQAKAAAPQRSWRRMPTVVGLVGAIAAAIGFSFGLALRFSAAQGSGSSFLHPEQSFPKQEWKGTRTPSLPRSEVPVEQSGGDILPIDPLEDLAPIIPESDEPSRATRSFPTADPEPAPAPSPRAVPPPEEAPAPSASPEAVPDPPQPEASVVPAPATDPQPPPPSVQDPAP